MKLYNKLLEPHGVCGDDQPIMCTRIEAPALVMTLDELTQLCIHIVKEWVEETSDGSSIEEETAADLTKYLTSKGIKLNPNGQ
jgi:hypothetical protein